ASGGDAVQVTRAGGYASSFESPDGKDLYYRKLDEKGIFRMPAVGGTEVQVVSGVVGDGFAVTSKGIYFKNTAGLRAGTLELLDTASGKISTVAPMERGAALPSISPDGA